MSHCFQNATKAGLDVLVGDPHRAYFPYDRMTRLRDYAIATSLDIENETMKTSHSLERQSTMSKHHKINYIEWKSTNMIAAKAFYAKAFGWSFTDYGPDYAGLGDAGIDGGLHNHEGGDVPLIILYSENLEQSVIDVTQAGGTICQDIFSFPGGRRFHFKDTTGNELAIWSDQ